MRSKIKGLSPVSVSTGSWDPMISQVRDLTYVGLDDSKLLVIGCDSSGGAGEKSHDSSDWTFREAGFGAAKVAIMEVVATGAAPFLVVDNLCVEMHPSGIEILAGIRQAMAELPLEPALTGSDEVNIPTVQTGIGVTVIGVVEREECRTGTAREGDRLLAIGTPMGAPDGPKRDSDPRAASIETVLKLLEMPGVREVLPVGSRGIGYELRQLSDTAGLELFLNAEQNVNHTVSGGTSTTVIAAVDPAQAETVRSELELPVYGIGTLT